MKKIILTIICLLITIGGASADTYPRFLHSTMGENGIHPTGDFTLDITYEDLSVGIDIASDNLQLFKYSGTAWGANIASTHINFLTKSIGKNHAIYNISGLGLGKYRYRFSIDNLDGNTNIYEIDFHVDRPEFNISKVTQDIGLLENGLKSLSPEQGVSVKSIGAPYTVTMTKSQDLDYLSQSITQWNGSQGWGYTRDPYATNPQSQNLSSLSSVVLNDSPVKSNQKGILNNDILRFKLGAVENTENIAGEYEGELQFNINFTYCGEYNLNSTCKEYGKFIEISSGARKWEDGNIASSCYTYKYPENNGYEYLGDIGDGQYWIQPDSAKPAFKVFCDMTTDGGGWTQYVNIKGNYTFEDAKSCWLGTNISNNKLECFNPNRYGVKAEQLFNDEWNGNKYYYDLISSTPSLTTTSSSGQRKCLGHDEYMTIMKANSTPLADGTDTRYVRLGRSFCKYSRETGGSFTGRYMSYDRGTGPIFGQSTGAARQSNAKFSKIYYREVDLGFTQNTKTIIDYTTGKRWSDGTYAKTCDGYKNPSVGYAYSGSIGDGDYWIDSDGIGGSSPFIVTCDMTTDSGGWTRIRSWNLGTASINTNGSVLGGDEILMTYKRQNDLTKDYAIRIDEFKVKHCGEEYTTAGAFTNHLQTGSWGSCDRKSTAGDYNSIKTTELVEGIFVEDTCVNGNNHKATSRNTSWWPSGGKGQIQFRVSNTTVLMGPEGNGSSRCAGSIQSSRKQTAVDTWVR